MGEVCVCRPGRIKNKTGGRLTRTESGPAAQGWGLVHIQGEVCVCLPGRIKNNSCGSMTRTEEGPAAQGWGLVHIQGEVCVCRPGRIKNKAGERLTRTDGDVPVRRKTGVSGLRKGRSKGGDV